MRTFALASGSSGNCFYIESMKERILVDLGLTFSKTKEILFSRDVNVEDITGVFITHEHADHISGLNELNKQTECTRVMGEESESEVIDLRVKENEKVKIENFIN